MAQEATSRRTATPTQAQALEEARKRRAAYWLWAGFAFVGLVVISLPTVMVVGLGMLPTVVAGIVDRSEQKYATCCVGGMNFSGVFPYLLDLWTGFHTFEAASDILTDVFALVVMYGTAGFGWMVFIGVPPVIATFLTVLAQRRVSQLRASQRNVVEEWGEGVAKAAEQAG